MKILVLTNLYPPHYLGGYELICHAVVNALRARGHAVQILTSNHRVENPKGAEDPHIERSLLVHGFYGHPWRGIQSLAKLEIANNRILKSAVERHRPELVYVWNMGGISKSLLTTLETTRLPVVFYMSDHWIARGLAADVWMNWWNHDGSTSKKAARALLSAMGVRIWLDRVAPTTNQTDLKFRRIYFCSKALRKITASAGFDVMHGSVIYCPVDTKKFTGVAKTHDQPCRNLLWVGRLAEDKGILTALRAMKALPAGMDVHLNVFGGGDALYVQQLKDFVATNRLPVTFQRASMDEMPRVYREHDALLFTSEWAEPFALTPLEAMASGLPVIGTTTGGSRELFRDRDNSLTYTAGQPDELADRIVRIVRDPELRARIAATGQAEVRANYDEPHIVDQIEAYLKETLEIWPALK
jgi:glycosyltransferase involved in cell wall biosynthesis